MITSESIHAPANGNISFFFIAELYSIVYMCVCVCVCMYMYTYIHTYLIFFIYSFISGHFGSFHVLAIANHASMNTEVPICKTGFVFVLMLNIFNDI